MKFFSCSKYIFPWVNSNNYSSAIASYTSQSALPNKIKEFLRHDKNLYTLLAALSAASLLNKNYGTLDEIKNIVEELSKLQVIDLNGKERILSFQENMHDLLRNLSAEQVMECHKEIHKVLFEISFPGENPKNSNISFQNLLDSWVAKIEKIYYLKFNIEKFEPNNLNQSFFYIFIKLYLYFFEWFAYIISIFDVRKNGENNNRKQCESLSIQIKNILINYISSIAGNRSWYLFSSVYTIVLDTLSNHLTNNEILNLRLTNDFLHSETTRNNRNIKINNRHNIKQKLKIFSAGGINKITMRGCFSNEENWKNIALMLEQRELLENLLEIELNGGFCRVNNFTQSWPAFKNLSKIKFNNLFKLNHSNGAKEPLKIDFSPLKNMDKLRKLEIKNSHLTKASTDSLGNLKNLHSLILDNNNLDDIDFSFIPKLKKLKYLTINSPDVTDDTLESIGQLEEIKDLFIYDCSSITDRGIENLCNDSRFFEIEKLSLNNARKITDKAIKFLVEQRITCLRQIELSNAEKLTNKTLAYFANIRTLKTLSLRNCPSISINCLRQLTSQRPDLELNWVDNES